VGEQIATALSGTLYHVPQAECARVAGLDAPAPRRTAIFATLSRLNTLYMVARAGSGHLGGSFSGLDVVTWLFLEEMGADDLFFSSKGHDAPGYYATRIGLGQVDEDHLHRLRRLGGLPGHPDVTFPGVVTNTGSLGMGISKAKGLLYGRAHRGTPGRVFVMLGDGELQEGQIWESLVSAANDRLGNLVAIVDHNKLQSDTFLTAVSDLGDLEAKFAAFGWAVERCDGHDAEALAGVFGRFAAIADRPKMLIADTIKGRGVRHMEHTAMESDAALYRFHSGAPDAETYRVAVQELIDTANRGLAAVNAAPLELQPVEAPARPAPGGTVQKLVAAYSEALLAQAEANDRLVALDADLMLDMGLIPFRDRFPDRFVECGIAEQDMVSRAGGMALAGLLPVVNSFGCFLSARPNEQIYNNATENTHVVYVGGLSGLIPGGPGHSHQAVRDIGALRGVPGLALAAPCTEAETAMALDLLLNHHRGPGWLRLESVPWPVPFDLPPDYRPEIGRGVAVTEGEDAVLLAYGPVMLSQAYAAAEELAGESIGLAVVNLPWPTIVDPAWLAAVIGDARMVFTLDNHYLDGGMGQTVLTAMAESGLHRPVRRLGVDRIPVCGTHPEVLAAHGLDAASLAETVRRALAALG